MKKAILFLCCLLLGASFAVAQKIPDSKDVETEIRRLEELGRTKSLRGDADWDGLWAEDAHLVDVTGKVTIYKKGLNLGAGFAPPKAMKMSEMIVRVYGETAVVTALMEIEAETADKKPFTFSLRFMNVWRKFADGWKIVASESTPVRLPAK
ncbi:MAG: nuclear transport factor 2 family protein [Acidobacteria bacterium]|nr:nuclear transport factor 2 family protein [Acidobacteriota bacterium]